MADVNNRQVLQELIGDTYQLQWVIGHGGMSTVWLADDHDNDREVAVKILRPEFSDNAEFLDRFRNEADAARAIKSDNVVSTYDYGEVKEDSGSTFCYIVMEYVRGESLADLLQREGHLSEELALNVLEQAAHGLAVIHRMDMVHRDIKPGNLLITQNGQVKIADFGIAKAAEAVPLTRTGMVVGTAQYVSPEQAQGHTVTPASDVYSLGVVGYEMLSGRRPFGGDSSVSVALAHINQAPEALTTQISAPARELIGIALRKDPATRFADGNEFTVAASKVRLGQRPPAPKSAALAHPAPEPAPSASTQQLGQVTNPTTTHPATTGPRTPESLPLAPSAMAQAPQPAVQQATRTAPPAQKSGAGVGFGCGMFIALLLAGIFAAALWAMATYTNVLDGVFNSNDQATTTPSEPSPVIVTEWVDPNGGSGNDNEPGGQRGGGGNNQPGNTGDTGEQGNQPRPDNQPKSPAPVPDDGGSGNGGGAGTGNQDDGTADATSGTGQHPQPTSSPRPTTEAPTTTRTTDDGGGAGRNTQQPPPAGALGQVNQP